MGRLLLPKAAREHLRLKPGDELEVSLEADTIRLRPIPPVSPLAKKAGLLIFSSAVPLSAWDLGTFLDDRRNLRSRETGGL